MGSLRGAALVVAWVVSSAIVACSSTSAGGGGSHSQGGKGGGAAGDSGTGASDDGGQAGESGDDGARGGSGVGGAGGSGGMSTGGSGGGGMSTGGDGGSGGMGAGSGGASTGGDGLGGMSTGGDGGSFPGGSGPGGSSGSGGAGGGGGVDPEGCEIRLQSCNYLYIVEPDTTSFKDEDSSRPVQGHWCYAAGASVWHTDTVCAYTEVCELNMSVSACVSCGERGRRTNRRTVNGTLTDDCEGCSCGGFYVASCFADTTRFGEPYFTLSFPAGTNGLTYLVGVSGQVHYAAQSGSTATISNLNVTIAPNGLVEFDIVADRSFTNDFGMPETWHLVSHVVSRCQQ